MPLIKLKQEYAQKPTIFCKSNDEEMINHLIELCKAYTSGGNEKEIERLEHYATEIGEELNRRGGIEEMRQIFNRLPNEGGLRILDIHWGGIGDWRG